MKLNITHDKKHPTNFTITAEITAEELIKIETKLVNKLSKNIKVSGFRKGKAPQHMLKAQLNPQILESEVMQEALNLIYSQSITEFKLELASQPKADILEFVPSQSMKVSITGDTWPEIKLADLSKIPKLEAPKIKVKQDDIDSVLNNIKKQFATKTEVARPVKIDDQAWINFVGKTEDGELVPGASGNDYPLAIGSKTFIPGFEEALVGMKAEEVKTFETTFPSDYRMEALRDKKVIFTVTLNKVEELKLPELTPELAAKCGPYDTVEALVADIEAGISEQESSAWREAEKAKLAEKFASMCTFDLPKTLLDDQVESSLQNIKTSLNEKSESLEEYLKTNGVSSEQELKDKVILPEASKQLGVSLCLRELAVVNDITVSPEELSEITNNLLRQYPGPEAQAAIMSQSEQARLRARRMTDKVLDFLLEAALKN